MGVVGSEVVQRMLNNYLLLLHCTINQAVLYVELSSALPAAIEKDILPKDHVFQRNFSRK